MRILPLSFALTLALAAGAASAAPPTAPGWRVLPDQTAVQPVAEAIAWRYDDGQQPMIDVWLATAPLSDEQRRLLKPRREGLPYEDANQPETLGLGGLLLRFDDGGSDRRAMLAFCIPADAGVDCSGGSGLGNLLVQSISAERVSGAFYTRSKDGKTLHVARFDAPLSNESSTPLPSDAEWSSDGGEAGKAFLAHNAAQASGDLDALERTTLPERHGDFDNPSTLRLLARMAMTKPQVLSAMQRGDNARLWVQDQDMARGFPDGITTIEMQNVEGAWRVVGSRR